MFMITPIMDDNLWTLKSPLCFNSVHGRSAYPLGPKPPRLPYEVSNPNLGPSYSWTPAGRGEQWVTCIEDVRETK